MNKVFGHHNKAKINGAEINKETQIDMIWLVLTWLWVQLKGIFLEWLNTKAPNGWKDHFEEENLGELHGYWCF